MTWDIVITIGIAAAAVVLFATEKMRMDAVALLVLTSLALLGQVNTEEALSGFSNAATVTVAAMFVLAAGLQNSGALDGIGSLLGKVKSRWLFLAALFAVTAAVSPFVNNTAVVAVFIPIVIAAAQNIKMPPSKALIPLSYVSQMAGVCTLIGTSTNLLVNAIAKQQGHRGFGMFEFTPLGLVFLLVGCVYLLLLGRWLLPESSATTIDEQQAFGKYVAELKVGEESALVGQTADEAALNSDFKVYLLGLLRGGDRLSTPSHQTIQAGDILLLRGQPDDLMALRDKMDLQHYAVYHNLALRKDEEDDTADLLMAEVMIAPSSKWAGSNGVYLNRQWNRNVTLWGIQRRGRIVRERLRNLTFEVGDILLITLPKEDMPALRQDNSFIVLSENRSRTFESWRAPFAIGVMVSVVLVSALGWAPIAVTALAGAVLMALGGCLSGDDVYQRVDWRIIILLAGLLPLGQAMANSGAAQFIVDHTIGRADVFGPYVVLGILYLMTMILTEFMSNAGTAVLLTPIAVSTAQALGVDASPFIVAVVFASATSFMTPVGYQTNTMVYGAGGYKFTDFLKIGLPLNLIYWGLGMLLIPVFWPFAAG